MKNKKLYKYINLLLRYGIGILAFVFIYYKLKDEFIYQLQFLNPNSINYILLSIVIVLLFLNWGIEAFKWRLAIKKIEKITLIKAFRCILTGITLSLLTPNRIGEIPARALLLNKTKFKELTLKTTVASFSQLLITLFLGAVALIFTVDFFKIPFNSLVVIIGLSVITFIFGLIYFQVNRFEKYFNRFKYFKKKQLFAALSTFTADELFKILLLSSLRYFVFFLQFFLILKAVGVNLTNFQEIMLIPVCFMIASSIPTLLISEIGVRGSVALFVFSVVSDMQIEIILASILLWVINVAAPALLGVFNLKEVKILKEH